MKILKGFELCQVAGKTLAVPSGELLDEYQDIIRMNEPSADVWRWIEADKTEAEICDLYAETYDIPLVQAQAEVNEVIGKMIEAGVLEK